MTLTRVSRRTLAVWAGAATLAVAGVAGSVMAAGSIAGDDATDAGVANQSPNVPQLLKAQLPAPEIGEESANAAILDQGLPVPDVFAEALNEDPGDTGNDEPELVQATSPDTASTTHEAPATQAVELNDEDDGGVPADSPACENVGCAEVETPDGLVKNLPQPAADGIERAKELRDQAQENGDPNGEETLEDAENGEENGESETRGVPEDSPACENVGCGSVENAGGVSLHLPQPAVDGINRAAENRENAGANGNGNGPVGPPG